MRPTLHDRLSFLLATGLVATSLLTLGLRMQVMGDHSIDFGGSELNVLHGIAQVVRGLPIYSDPEQAPFAVVQYTPAYHVITGKLCMALGIAADDVRGLQQINRAFSLLLNLLTMLVMALAARAARGGPWASVSAAALTSLAFSPHFFARIDSLYAFFFASTILFVLRWSSRQPDRAGTPELVLAGLCTALALLSKQTAVLLLLIVPLGLVSLRTSRPVLVYLVAFLSAFALLSLLFLHGEGLQLVLKNCIGGLRNGISTAYLDNLLRSPQLLGLGGWLIIALVLGLRWQRAADPPKRLLGIALIVGLIFAGATALKAGSDYNYFFEVLALSFLASAAWLKRESACMLKVLLLGQCMLFAGIRLLALREWRTSFRDESALVATWDAEKHLESDLKRILTPGQTVVLTYRSPLEVAMSDIVLVGQRDIIQWSNLPPYDLRRFDAMMRDGRVRYVISDRRIDSMRFIGWEYPLELERSVEGRWLYVPVTR